MSLGLFNVSRRWPRQCTQGNDGTSFREQGNFFTLFHSICRPYITFKLPRGDMDAPPCPRNFFRYLAIGMCHSRHLWNGMCDRHRVKNNCHAVHRSLSSGASLCSSTVGPSPYPILSAKLTYTISCDYWPLGCVTSAIFGMACVIVIERK